MVDGAAVWDATEMAVLALTLFGLTGTFVLLFLLMDRG